MPKIKANYSNPEHLEMLDQFREGEIEDIKYDIREIRTEVYRLFTLLWENKHPQKKQKIHRKKSK